jgi:asparagine synthase (glutamine-hydrolysing)
MCGITGVFDTASAVDVDESILVTMAEALHHRGPDESSYFTNGNVGFGFKRLSIVDLANGHQPFFSDDRSVVLVCNGEIYNHHELRRELAAKGHRFKTSCDVEVILNMYLEYGTGLVNRLNGQFAFAIWDGRRQRLFLARDQFGICPLFHAFVDGVFLFGSEIKAILKHPLVRREVDLTGLDQVFAFPGMVSPRTMFKNVHSLKPGHFLLVDAGKVQTHEYWDLDYPVEPHDYGNEPESYYLDQLDALLTQSVKYRLQSDVPVGFYLSGGLDSSLIGGIMKKINPGSAYESFSIMFPHLANKDIDECRYQRLMAGHLNSIHNEISFDWPEIGENLREAIYHSEGPLKETYNTCSLALSRKVRERNMKVILTGEGSDELFGGYVGYRFDVQRQLEAFAEKELGDFLEEQTREELWGDRGFFYEKKHLEFSETVQGLYSRRAAEHYADFDCLRGLGLNKSRITGRHPLHKRSYLDFKLRLSDHLVSDHGDRVCYANSVEGRYPFLDVDLVEFIRKIPPRLKVKDLVEKYILKQLSARYLPKEIYNRQKFGFVAPGSPQLLRNNIEWVNDMLSYDNIKKQGYFDPDAVERVKKIYGKENFKLHLPFDSDLLIVVLTFNIFLSVFDMPDL